MTQTQKKLAIGGFVLLAIVFLLWSRKGSAGTTIVNQNNPPAIQVDIPGFNLPPRGDINISIPALPTRSQYSYNAISPCMCNGGAMAATPAYSDPLVTFVTNQGAQGPNVYNFNPIDSRHDGISGNAASVFAATGSYYYSPGGYP